MAKVRSIEELEQILESDDEFDVDITENGEIWATKKMRPDPSPNPSPTIVCLCGSTRFYKEFQRANYEETMAGNIVLSVGFYWHASKEAHGEEWGCTPEQKVALDELHKRKIDLADEILVINVDGYIGESTRSEIEYAKANGKKIRILEVEDG